MYATRLPPDEDLPRGTTFRHSFQITFPQSLDFGDALEDTLEFFRHLRVMIGGGRHRVVRIDHSALQKITPGAALVLIAELIKLATLNPGCRLRGNMATNPEVRELLGQVGYWEYFAGFEWKSEANNSKVFLKHRFGNRTSGKTVNELIGHFLPEAKLSGEARKALYTAIVECMDNVMKHAYPIEEMSSHFYCQWWLLGYRDSKTHEISFCFFDQGLGIAKTIRTRLKDRLGPLSADDSALIVKAVVDGHYSSTKDPTRGRGLPTLKRFVDQAEAGELMIVSRQSRCIFWKNNCKEVDFRVKLGGTLIAWTLQN